MASIAVNGSLNGSVLHEKEVGVTGFASIHTPDIKVTCQYMYLRALGSAYLPYARSTGSGALLLTGACSRQRLWLA